MSERFLTLSEVRAMLKLSRATLWRWTAENGLKVVRVGSVTRIRESDLEAFLKRHEERKPQVEEESRNGFAAVLQDRIETNGS